MKNKKNFTQADRVGKGTSFPVPEDIKAIEFIQNERQELELEFSSKKSSLNDRERNAHESRRKATELYLTGMAEAKGVHALKNLELQNQRHKIFEAYRNSGGANLAEDSQQMYPEGWSRPKPKDGGVSDEEQ